MSPRHGAAIGKADHAVKRGNRSDRTLGPAGSARLVPLGHSMRQAAERVNAAICRSSASHYVCKRNHCVI